MTLVGYWPLNETTTDSGQTAKDHSGNENHGDVTGAGPQGTGTVTGPTGQTAYDFDGSDDEVAFSSFSFAANSDGMSVTSWVKRSSTGSDDAIIEFDDSNTQWELWIESGTGGEVWWVYQSSGSNGQAKSSGTIGTSWTHIAATVMPGNTTMKIYIDGKLDTEYDYSGDGSQNNTASQNRIGKAHGSLMKGSITDVRIYNRALSPAEIAYLYQVSQHARLVSNKKTS